MRNSFLRLLAALALIACGSLNVFGYDLIYGQESKRVTWNAGSIPFVIRMSQTANLQDGTSYAGSVQAAMTTWNAQVTQVQFAPSIAASGLANDGDGVNEIAFDTKIYSNSTDPENPPQDFGENTLAVTLSWVATSPRGDGTYQRTQSDILFNSKWDWNSYRGALQQPEEIRRVAIHELGHVLGLDHPDEDGQSVTAIMNAYVSNIDSLQTDDLTGAQLLYGRPGGFSPPRNDNFMYATPIYLNNDGGAAVTWPSIGATKESGEPHHGHDNDGASIWWKWTATANGTLTVNTLGTNFDTVLAAYTGGYVNTLTQLATNDDTSNTERRSTITFSVTSGTNYSIAVGGWDAQWGIAVVNFAFTPGATDVAPSIITHPSSQTAIAGGAVVFSVAANGSPAPSYQWQRLAAADGQWTNLQNSEPYSGATGTTLAIHGATLAMNGDRFRCIASNSAGTATSAEASLTVTPAPPQISDRPLSRTFVVGQRAVFSVGATGEGSLTYQWRRNGQPIVGATEATYSLASVAISDAGYYEVVVTNSAGSTRSIFNVSVAPANATASVWGNGSDQERAPPVGAAGFVQVAAGVVHSMGLKADGTVISWGNLSHAEAVVPSDLSDVVRITARGNVSAAVRSDGAVVVWGSNFYHQLDVPAGLSAVVDVSVGGQHCLALTAAGTVVAWGSNSRGQTTVPAGLQNVVAVAAGTEHSVALLADQTVVVWGGNASAPQTPPAGLSNVKAIAVGGSHNLALKTDGTVVGWGFDYNGQVSGATGLSGVVAVAAGSSHSAVLKSDGSVVAFGNNFYRQTETPPEIAGVFAVAAGDSSTMVLLSPAAPSFSTQPANATVNGGEPLTFSLAVKGRPTPSIQWRKDGVPLTDGGRVSGATSSTLRISDAKAEDSGDYYAVATNSAGTATSSVAAGTVIAPPSFLQAMRTLRLRHGDPLVVDATAAGNGTYSWRHNDTYLSFTGSTLRIPAATPANSGFYVVTVSNVAGRTTRVFHVHVAGTNRLVGWGANEVGQTTIPSGLEDVGNLVAGNGHAAALRADGTVVAWGRNDFGQRSVPAGLADVVQLAAGGEHMLALKADGTVVAWGRNQSGQCTIPADLTDVVQIAAGAAHSVALKGNGAVVAWGGNESGQASVPVSLRMTYAIAAGESHTLALTDIGLAGWGSNGMSESAIGSSSSSVFAAGSRFTIWTMQGTGQLLAQGSIIAPFNVNQVTALSARRGSFVALKSDGSVNAWGQSGGEQIGVPTALGNVQLVAAGDGFFVAAAAVAPPTITRQPQDAAVALGTSLSFSVEANAVASYRWFKDDVALTDGGRISGSDTATLTITDVEIGDQGRYRVRLTNAFREVFSDAAACTIHPLLIAINPATASADGGTVTLSVAVSGKGPFTFQWYAGSSGDLSAPVADATDSNLVVSQDDRLGRYWVRVAGAGTVVASETMAVGRWTLVEPFFGSAYLYGTASGGGTHVIVGEAAGYSSNGRDWHRATIDAGVSLGGVVHDGTRFLAGGRGGQLFTSSDGRVWENIRSADAGSSETVSSVAHGNGITVFAGFAGKLMTVSGGSHWAWRTVAEQNGDIYFQSVAFGAGRFVAVGHCVADGSRRLYQSIDGSNWARCTFSLATSNASYPFGGFAHVFYVGGRFVVLGRSQNSDALAYALLSVDGLTWTTPFFTNRSIGVGTVHFVAGQLIDSSLRTSKDGLVWSDAPTSEAPAQINAIGYADWGYFAVTGWPGSSSASALWTSTDLVQWSRQVGVTVPAEAAYGDDRFVAVNANLVSYSSDGVSWRTAALPSDYSFGSVAYANGLFVATNNYAPNGYTHYTSFDGIAWTPHNFLSAGQTAALSGIAHLGGRWMMWGGEKIFISSDGVDWSRGSFGASVAVNSIAYGNGRYVGVGANGLVIASVDGASWSEPAAARPTVENFRKVVFGAGVFVAYDQSNSLWQSVDGSRWTSRGTHPGTIFALAFGGGQFVAARGSDLLTSSDGRLWQVVPGALSRAGGDYRAVTGFLHVNGTWWGATNVGRWLRAPFSNSVPILDAGPSNRIVASGGSATLAVTANGENLTYQWFSGETGDTSQPIAGANAASFTTGAVTQTTRFWVRVSNTASFIDSATAAVVIGTGPRIGSHPQSADVVRGTAANLAVATSGVPAPTYQWYYGRTGDTSRPISGATGAGYLTPPNATISLNYWVRVSNSFGSADSDTATVTPWTKLESVVASSFQSPGDSTLRVRTASAWLVTADGIKWRRHDSSTGMDAVTFGNGVYVGATNNSAGGAIFTSSDGLAWTQRYVSGTAQIAGSAFGGGQFIIVGPGRAGGVLSSTDGLSWTVRSFGSNASDVGLGSICYDNGLFLGAGADSRGEPAIMTSPDGVTWTRRQLTLSGNFFSRRLARITRAGSLYFAFGEEAGVIASSTDGVTWTQRQSPSPNVLNSVAWLNGTYCLGDGSDRYYTSTDGLNWITRAGPSGFQLDTVYAFNGRFVGASETGAVHTSVDAVTWELKLGVPPSGYSDVASLVHGAGRFVSSGFWEWDHFSADGLTWAQTQTSIGNQSGGLLFHALGRFFCTDTERNGRYWHSSDGSNWQSAQITGFPSLIQRFEFANGMLVALGAQGNFSTSVDGFAWTNRSIGVDEYLYAFAYGNGRYVAATSWNLWSSIDLVNWTMSSQADVWVQRMHFGAGVFVGVGSYRFGNDGKILTSPDGMNWTERQPSGFAMTEGGLEFDGQRFWILGGALYNSEDGLTWRARPLPFNANRHFAMNSHTTVIASYGAFWRSTDLGEAFSIATQPTSSRAAGGSAATFAISATDDGVFYRWQTSAPGSSEWIDVFDDQNFHGTSDATLLLRNVALQHNGTRFRCRVTNGIDDVVSDAATLEVFVNTPVVTIQPISRVAPPGGSVEFSVSADGPAPLSYQWRKDGIPLNGATAASYTIGSVQLADAGSYDVVVTNEFGFATSSVATLTVKQFGQTITFATPSALPFGTMAVTLSAAASSGLVVGFEVVSGPASISGDQLTLFGVGSVTVRATQPGNTDYAAAAPVERTFTVTPTFDSWLLERFTPEEIANAALTGANADYDKDGLPNLVEYALGLDPKLASVGSAPTVSLESGQWTLTYSRPADRADVTYAAQMSADLTSWTTTGVTHALVSSSNGTETWRATYPVGSAPACFLRLRVTR